MSQSLETFAFEQRRILKGRQGVVCKLSPRVSLYLKKPALLARLRNAESKSSRAGKKVD